MSENQFSSFESEGQVITSSSVRLEAPREKSATRDSRNTQPISMTSSRIGLQEHLTLFCRVLAWMMVGLGCSYISLVPGYKKIQMVATVLISGVLLIAIARNLRRRARPPEALNRIAWLIVLILSACASMQFALMPKPVMVIAFSLILLGSAFVQEDFAWHLVSIVTVCMFWAVGSFSGAWNSFQSDLFSSILMSVFLSVIVFELRRKEVESIQEVSSKQHNQILKLTSDVVQHVSADGSILFVNQNWLDKLGYEEDDLEGMNIFDIIPEVHHRRCRAGLERLNAGAQLNGFPLPLVSRKGDEIMFCGNVLSHVDPMIGRWSEVFLRDMTEVASERESFLRFVPKAFLNLLGRDDYQEIELGDHVVGEVTVLYSDLRNFTRFAEKLSPNDLFYFLNSYFGRMQPVIEQYGGVIDKYLGDGILAVFPPMRNSNHSSADRAVLAAHTMVSEMERFNAFRRNTNRREIGFGIGVNTGVVMMGTVGTRSRMDTTVVGHAVNVAARLESLTKDKGELVLISGATHERLSPDVLPYVNHSGETYIRGLEEPVRLFTLSDQKWWDSRTLTQKADEKTEASLGAAGLDRQNI